jgi:hypothetical protein
MVELINSPKPLPSEMTMSQDTLESRVAQLERQMARLLRSGGPGQPDRDAWRKTVGMFRGDPIFGEMIEEAQRMREEDRRLSRDATEPVIDLH